MLKCKFWCAKQLRIFDFDDAADRLNKQANEWWEREREEESHSLSIFIQFISAVVTLFYIKYIENGIMVFIDWIECVFQSGIFNHYTHPSQMENIYFVSFVNCITTSNSMKSKWINRIIEMDL